MKLFKKKTPASKLLEFYEWFSHHRFISRMENFYDFQFHGAVQLKATRFKYLLFLYIAEKADKFSDNNDDGWKAFGSVTIKCRIGP